jgi:hypothetical protein
MVRLQSLTLTTNGEVEGLTTNGDENLRVRRGRTAHDRVL